MGCGCVNIEALHLSPHFLKSCNKFKEADRFEAGNADGFMVSFIPGGMNEME